MKGTLSVGMYPQEQQFDCDLCGAGGGVKTNRLRIEFVNEAEFERAESHREALERVDWLSFYTDARWTMFQANHAEIELHPDRPGTWHVTLNRDRVEWFDPDSPINL